jgi:hypothetical protein
MNTQASTTPVFTSHDVTRLIAACEAHELNPWEREFIASLRKRRRSPTEKQVVVLRRIAAGDPSYRAIAQAAIRSLPDVLARWLPDGKLVGREYIALNPRRADRTAGSFSVNIRTGEWSDFATKERGRSAISLAAYLHGVPLPEAAKRLAGMLGMKGNGDV